MASTEPDRVTVHQRNPHPPHTTGIVAPHRLVSQLTRCVDDLGHATQRGGGSGQLGNGSSRTGSPPYRTLGRGEMMVLAAQRRVRIAWTPARCAYEGWGVVPNPDALLDSLERFAV